jgi:hypothetical protein
MVLGCVVAVIGLFFIAVAVLIVVSDRVSATRENAQGVLLILVAGLVLICLGAYLIDGYLATAALGISRKESP